MRSRLEASFAQWLDIEEDTTDWPEDWPLPINTWTYEPHCYASKDGQYLPDFYVHFGWRDRWEYCEVKPKNADLAGALKRMHIILASEPEARLGVWAPIKGDDPVGGFWPFESCISERGCGACERAVPSDPF